jgi:hypothetical protein
MNNDMLVTIDDESLDTVAGGATIGGVIGGTIDGTLELIGKLLKPALGLLGSIISGAGQVLSGIGGALGG